MFHDLTLASVTPLTSDAVALEFDVPETLRDAFAFVPGQYLTLRTHIDGQEVRRSYSIASQPDQTLTVGVKCIEDGTFSTWAQTLKAGSSIEVMAPEGRFTCEKEQNVILIAAGSGITPMMAIAADALSRGARVSLVFGNRDTQSIMFRDALDGLKNRYLDRFTLIHILSREPQDVDLLSGRIDAEKIKKLAQAGAIDLKNTNGVFLCGPGAMIDAVSQALIEASVSKDHIHFERFYQDGETPRLPASQEARAAAQAGVAVNVVLDGAQKRFDFGAADETVLDAAARQGHELPFSCKGGMCCTCRCKVTEGSAEMAVNYSLEPWELEAGFTLACQARPTSDRLTLDFDAA